MSSKPRRHHFIPQCYLAAWADGTGQVGVRRRNSPKVVTPHIKNVGIVSGLYGRGDDATRIERIYGQLEVEWPRLRALLCEGDLLGRDDRNLISIFMALQISRTPDHLGSLLFVENVTEYAQTPTPTRDQVAEYLERRHLGFKPADLEVQAAWDLVTGFNNMLKGQPRIALIDAIGMSFGIAIDELAPRLAAHRWVVRSCRKRWLVTTDRPVTNWTSPHPNDQIRGIGLMDAVEIRLPISPSHLLVLMKTGPDISYEVVQPRHFTNVSLEAARRCGNTVIATPGRRTYLQSLELATEGPKLRFNTGPGIRTMPDGRTEKMGAVLHMYTPRY